ncbi:MAG: NAD(P)-dependent oxidoreductase, partial [Acidobacteriota bacterium]|nr:NAD(P)-dependent oxidoreductase [Acidobacteriota bacterium]
MSTTLITGGSGFLGSFIADELSQRGHAVRLFDRTASPYRRNDQEMFVGDIDDREALMRAAAGCDVVYHLAAMADLEEAH